MYCCTADSIVGRALALKADCCDGRGFKIPFEAENVFFPGWNQPSDS